jgi:hypothetical protein
MIRVALVLLTFSLPAYAHWNGLLGRAAYDSSTSSYYAPDGGYASTTSDTVGRSTYSSSTYTAPEGTSQTVNCTTSHFGRDVQTTCY